ncbi:helix-turn-helix domain-containing protein [Paraglaciecola chathamensis]|uniref:Helix-turn-helix domain-containing protein n=1 Tax=Paraglaciecola chathamensis TaxID=368405 RepID=A0ABS0W9V2_9ALTE|nr:helix-turn-helix domain-containing protein [Paraglaciecola chathamensis]MBJ2135246.1 helix-turn-helix domain-containing protein [Paraglaciecola chathamensis]
MDDDKAIATRKGIGSLELGLEVLELISEHCGPISLTKLSELAKMSPSRLHKYLVSLTKLGYVSQLDNFKYMLSNSSIRLGMSALKHSNPVQVAFEYADKLHQELDKTITVTIWNGDAPLVIKWLDSSHFLAVNIRLGSKLSPFTSAAGRVFLSHLPKLRCRELVEHYYDSPAPMPRHMGKPIKKAVFYELLKDIKQSNLCCFKEDFLPDINVVSAPIFSLDGSVSTVISLLGNSKVTPVSAESIYVLAVKKASIEASRK